MIGRAWVALLLVGHIGCSYLQIDRPPRAVRVTDSVPQCTTENTWPIVDVGLAVVGVGGGIGIATGVVGKKMESDGTKRDLTSTEKWFFASASIVEGLLFALSAGHGYRATAQCRKLRAGPTRTQAPFDPDQAPPQQQPYPQAQPYPPPQPYPNPQPGGTP